MTLQPVAWGNGTWLSRELTLIGLLVYSSNYDGRQLTLDTPRDLVAADGNGKLS